MKKGKDGRRYWNCWKSKPRDTELSPCGYDKPAQDPACAGCADNPTTKYLNNLDDVIEEVAASWARRWGQG